MFREEEEKLLKAKESYSKGEIPNNIDDYIKKGIQQGKINKNKGNKRKFLSLVAGFICIVFIASIRFSPVFASFIENILGLSNFGDLVKDDQGLRLAVENNFYQVVGESDEHEDLTFTVEHIIVDESQLLIFYSIDTTGDHRFITISSIDFFDGEGNQLRTGCSYGKPVNWDLQEKGSYKEYITLDFNKKEIPSNITMKVKLEEENKSVLITPNLPKPKDILKPANTVLQPTWQLQIPIEHIQFEDLKEVYEIDQEVEIDGQKIYFGKLTQHPTKIVVDFQWDEKNTKQIFGFYNLRIEDENGNPAEPTSNLNKDRPYGREVFSDGIKYWVNLESHFFNKPKELYIVADGIRALDKSLTKLTIDLENKKILGDYNEFLRLRNIKVDPSSQSLQSTFGLKVEEEGKTYFIFDHNFTDATGKTFESGSCGASKGGTENAGKFNTGVYYNIPLDEDIKSPITLKIVDYPAVIKEKIKIRVK